jgi:tetratricopeptide (TPR) repeat protein
MPGAANLLERAAALLPPTAPARVESLLDLGECLARRGDFARAQEVLVEAESAADALGDRSLAWRARIQAARNRINTDPSPGAIEAVGKISDEAIAVFEEFGDEGGLARAWHVRGLVEWLLGRAGATEAAFERAARHARLAGDLREESEALAWIPLVSTWGSATVDEAIARSIEVVERGGGDRKVEAFALVTRGAAEAARGNVDQGRALVARGRTILLELGVTVDAAAMSQSAGMVEMQAGDPAAAERALREGFDTLSHLGEKAYLSSVAALLADALCSLGRDEEADGLTRISEENAAPSDMHSQIWWRNARAKVMSARGEIGEAERLARDAVTLSEDTEFLETQADALLTLAGVLQKAERIPEAAEVARAALARYERKGYAVRAGWARTLLSDLEG